MGFIVSPQRQKTETLAGKYNKNLMLWIWIHLKVLPKIVFIKLPESNRYEEGINLWFLAVITCFPVHHSSKEVIAIATLSKGEFRKKK